MPLMVPTMLCCLLAALMLCRHSVHAEPERPTTEAQALYDQALALYGGDHLVPNLDKAEALFIQADDLAIQGQTLTQGCDNWVYGMGVQPDLRRAFQCAQRMGDKALLAQLYANGDVVTRDPAKALTLVHAALDENADNYIAVRALTKAAEKILADTQRASPDKIEIILACGDESTDVGQNLCIHYRDDIQEGIAKRRIQAVVHGLDESARPVFATYVDALVAYNQADMDCTVLEFLPGTMAGMIVFTWDRSVISPLDAFTAYRLTPGAQQDDLAKADAALNGAYRERMKAQNAEGKTCLRTAQRAWLKYRTAHVALYKAVYGTAHGAPQVELDTMLAMTKERTQQLQRP